MRAGRSLFLERFIHSEIYKARPDVMSVVHTHSPGVIPFGVSAGSAACDVSQRSLPRSPRPVWDIRKDLGETDMLVRDPSRGKSLAQVLGDKSVVLMRGHGDVTVGPSVKMAVFRAYYTDVNAKLQSQAIALGGDINYLSPARGRKPTRSTSPLSTASGISGSCGSPQTWRSNVTAQRRDRLAELVNFVRFPKDRKIAARFAAASL